jgi:hypothetical protein
MPILIVMVLFLTKPILAKIKDCYKEVSQAEKNECMAFQRDQAAWGFMTAVTEYCAAEEEIHESLGGSIYPMLLDECMAKKLGLLTRDLKSAN